LSHRAALASPPLPPRAVAARHRAVAASASPPLPPRAIAASLQLRLLLHSFDTTRAQTRPGQSGHINRPGGPPSHLATCRERHPAFPLFVSPLAPYRHPASPAPRAIRQLRQPRRATCPPQHSGSSCVHAIQSRPEQIQRWVACQQTCQLACRLVGDGLRGLGRQAGLRQHCPPLLLPVHLRIDGR
jgi:hypothetical protein